MGLIRDSYENPLFQGFSAEVTELFGADRDEISFYRFDEAASEPYNDPLWDEYNQKPRYALYKFPAFVLEYSWSTPTESPNGRNKEIAAVLKVSRQHLDAAGVPFDVFGNQVRENDIVGAFVKGDVRYFDILNVERKGFVNNTDQWTFIEASLRRNEKFSPERKL